MTIGILNNAANYLYFNINLARYLREKGHKIVFLNCDRFVGTQYKRYGFEISDYPKTETKEKPYHTGSGIVCYFERLYRLKSTKKLISELNQEYNRALSYFQQNHFDYVLILNGSFNVETDVCKKLDINTFFFEHGYFPNEIQMNRQGVNCDAEFARLPLKEFLNFHFPAEKFSPKTDFRFETIQYNKTRRYLLRLLDAKYNRFFSNFINKRISLSKAEKRFAAFPPDNFDLETLGKYIFFPLQVNSDTQIVINSPYNSMYEALDSILPELKRTGLKIVLKEHPKEVEPVDYSHYADNKQVFLLRKFDLHKLILHAEFVVNINSSVGLQAVAKHQKVLLLGESFYANSPLSVEFRKVKGENLKEIFESLSVKKELVDSYIAHFRNEIFIPGHFYTPDVNFLERISNRLV